MALELAATSPDHVIPGVDGTGLGVWELGGEGPVLLLAHATGFHTGCYRELAAGLTAHHRVVGLDCRGHGSSGVPTDLPAGQSWVTMAEDLLKVVDELDLANGGRDPLVAFGHSCGGATLLLAEAARPGTFAGLWCYEPVVFGAERVAALAAAREAEAPVTENPLAAGARRRRAVFADAQAAYDNYAAKMPLRLLSPACLADYVRFGFEPARDVEAGPHAVRLRCRPEVEAATYDNAGPSQAHQRPEAVACPTTIACGGPMADFGEDVARWLAGRLQAGGVRVYEDLSHFGPLQQPERMAADLLADLAGTAR